MTAHGPAALAFALVVGLAVYGCSLSEAIDCGRICARYSDCVREIDAEACQDRCAEKAEEVDALDALVDDCEACIDRGTCAEIGDCWDVCSPFVEGAR